MRLRSQRINADTLEQLRDRIPILALLSANAVSVLGNSMSAVAVPWFVLQTTGSAAKTGLTGAVMALGTVLAAFFGGPIVDRLGFKHTSVLSDLVNSATVALIPLLFMADYLAFWHLLVLVFLGAVLDAPGLSAREALIPDLARSARMTLERANSADAAIPRLAQFLGPPLAGMLIAALGAVSVLWLNAATFVFSAILVAAVVPSIRRTNVGNTSTEEEQSYFIQLLEGMKFVLSSRLILSLVFVVTVANLLDGPLQAVILPIYADKIFSSALSLGLILGGFGGGALAGTFLFGAIGHRVPTRLTFVLCFVLGGPSSYLALAATPPLPVLVGVFAVVGMLAGPINPISSTVFQRYTPLEMRGRVFGVLNAASLAATPIGMALGGLLVEGVGLVPTLVGMGACYLVITMTMFFNSSLYEMDAGSPRSSQTDPVPTYSHSSASTEGKTDT